MALYPSSTPSDYVSLLADQRRMPDAQAHGADEAVLDLVRAYSHHFASIVGDWEGNGEPLWYRMDRVKNSMQSPRERCAVSCLADTNATAALVKEIAFMDVPLNKDGSFEAVDLGCGTGILSIGAAIAGIRRGASTVMLHLVDEEYRMIQFADFAAECIGNDVLHVAHQGNIAQPELYRSGRFDPEYVRLWISETISQGTPSVRIVDDRVVWNNDGSHRYDLDPFPHVTHELTRIVSKFPAKARGNDVAMFPNIFNDRYRPGQNDALQLITSKSHAKHGPLSAVGHDFLRLNQETQAGSRW